MFRERSDILLTFFFSVRCSQNTKDKDDSSSDEQFTITTTTTSKFFSFFFFCLSPSLSLRSFSLLIVVADEREKNEWTSFFLRFSFVPNMEVKRRRRCRSSPKRMFVLSIDVFFASLSARHSTHPQLLEGGRRNGESRHRSFFLSSCFLVVAVIWSKNWTFYSRQRRL